MVLCQGTCKTCVLPILMVCLHLNSLGHGPQAHIVTGIIPADYPIKYVTFYTYKNQIKTKGSGHVVNRVMPWLCVDHIIQQEVWPMGFS